MRYVIIVLLLLFAIPAMAHEEVAFNDAIIAEDVDAEQFYTYPPIPIPSGVIRASDMAISFREQTFQVTYEVTYNALTLEEITDKRDELAKEACTVKIKEIKE